MTRRWTPEESASLGDLWAKTKITAAQIAIALQRTNRAVLHLAEKLGLPPRQKFWTPDEDERLKQLWSGRELMLRQIAEQLHKSKKEVARRAHILGLGTTRGSLYG